MKKLLAIGLIVGVLVLAVSPVALAAGRIPIEDATGFASSAGNDAELRIVSGGTGCVLTATSYMKFDLSDITTSLGSVKLTLKLTRVNVPGTATKLSLLKVNDDSWTESSVRTNLPVPDAEVGSVSYASGTQPVVGDLIVFDSSTTGDDRLVKFLNEQLTDDPSSLASLALRVTECGVGTFEYRVGSSESVDSLARPSLELFTPTAVDMSSFGASGPVEKWPLYAGLAAVALLAVAGVGFSRRRASLR